MSKAGIITLLALTLILSACSSINGVLGWVGMVHNNDLSEVRIESTADSNNNHPVSFDLVFVHNKELLSLLPSLNGPQWFQQKSALQLKYARQLSVLSVDVVPLTLALRLNLPNNSRDALGIFLCANYMAPDGQVVASLQTYERVKVLLSRDKYQLITDDN